MNGKLGGIGLGGILVILGILLVVLWGKLFLGVVVALIGLIAFGGFAKGKWY